jgi:PAS domain S-box-containing protein
MDPATLVGASVDDYPVPRELVERIMAAAKNAFDTGARQTVEYMLDDERGVRYQEARITPSGEDEFFVVVRDVTDRKQSEQDLQLSEQRSRALVEAIPDSMFRISLAGRILDYRVEPPIRLFRSEEDMIGSDVFDADFPREITARTMALGTRAVETGELQLHEYELEIDGELHHQEARITPSGEDEFLLIVRDVTQRKQQEQELQSERDFVAKVVNLAPTYFCVIRTDGRIVRYNDTLSHATGRVDDEEVRGERFQDVFVLPEQVEEFERVLAIANSGRDPGEFELQLRSAAGDVLDVLWRGVDIYDETGERRYLLCGLDVTERIRQREELAAQRARIVSAGDEERRRLERNLHDGAQQRLVSLSLSLRLAQTKLGSDLHAADELLSSASVELALALEELRELARGIHPAVLTERGLGPALESLADRAPLSVELRELPERRLPKPVEAAAYYVVAEALTNVAKYADASTVSVAVAHENGCAVVEVVDDGVGGADPALGSGLRGLADRVEALEGRLAVESERGVGTRVRAEIPYG